jgi:hypothetical protein
MNRSWIFYVVVVVLVAIYFIGEATGLLFFSMIIILPVWVWLLTTPDNTD